jgi:hypothetical protein
MITSDIADSFWSKVDIRGPHECWEWTAGKLRDGYGYLNAGGKKYIASRIAYQLTYSPPGSMCVCHTCDNPGCCNPAHLWLGTRAENIQDRVSKGRNGGGHPPEKLGEADVQQIRDLYKTGEHTYETLGEMFNISGTHVGYVVTGRRWAKIPA